MDSARPLRELVDPEWAAALEPVASNVAQLGDFLRAEVEDGRGYLPAGADVLRAFTYPMADARLLIVGQDPYPTPGHAVGLAFSISRAARPVPRSLQNISRELYDDLGIEVPQHGDLSRWAESGVVLLNRVLTVQPGSSGSHRGKGWEAVTEAAIRALVARGRPLVAILWGNDATALRPLLGSTPVIASAHPSPLSACRGFFGSRPFSRANRLLVEQGANPIDWKLECTHTSRNGYSCYMPNRTTIEIDRLSKRFGAVEAVSELTFRVEPGTVTGFLGPNGAGKTTTLRMLLGLVRPTEGTATIGGTSYRDLDRPLATVGTALEAASFHPGRTARNHLAVYAAAAGIPRARVGAVLDQVGLGAYGDRRVGGYSLGMRQRLGLAMALLGDPQVLVLDEPVNGLDPEGIRWIRTFLRELAAEGRTVLVSSHLLSEVQQSVDRLVVISKGKLVYEGGLAGLDTDTRVVADSPDRGMLDAALLAAGADIQSSAAGVIVSSLSAVEVGAIAHRAGVQLSLLHTQQGGLEKAFLDLVGEGSQP